MKKLFPFIIACIMMISLVACGEKEQTVTLSLVDSGLVTHFTLVAEGDIVHTIHQVTTLDCTGYTEGQLDVVKESVAQYKTIYNLIDGVTYNVEMTETSMIETFTIDASNKETISTLSTQGLMPIDGGGTISLEKTIKSLESQGWVVNK